MMLRSIGLFVVLAVAQCIAAAGTVTTPDAVFSLKEDWIILPGNGREQFTLRSAKRSAEVNVLTQRAPNVTSKNLQTAVRMFLKEAIETNEKSAKQRNLTLSEFESKVSDLGGSWSGEFKGLDSAGRRFHQVIVVQPGFVLGVYADSKKLSAEALFGVVTEILLAIRREP